MACRVCCFIVQLSLLCVITFSARLSASEIQSCSDTLVVNAPTEWPPYSTKFNDDYFGLDIEIVKIIFKEANLCWSFAEYPSTPRVLAELERGRLDVVFAASYTPEREAIANFTKPYRAEFMSLFTHKSNKKRFSLYSMSTVVVNRGGYYGENFEVFKKRCPECLVELSSTEQRITFLKNHRVDFAVMDELTGKAIIKQKGMAGEIVPTNHLIHKNQVHFMVSKSTATDLVERLNLAIKTTESKVNALVAKYRAK